MLCFTWVILNFRASLSTQPSLQMGQHCWRCSSSKPRRKTAAENKWHWCDGTAYPHKVFPLPGTDTLWDRHTGNFLVCSHRSGYSGTGGFHPGIHQCLQEPRQGKEADFFLTSYSFKLTNAEGARWSRTCIWPSGQIQALDSHFSCLVPGLSITLTVCDTDHNLCFTIWKQIFEQIHT